MRPARHCPHCGCEIESKPRSNQQHKRFFSLIKAAYHHWPTRHRFRPRSEEHLRKWLQVQAGYKLIKHIDAPKDIGVIALRDLVFALYEASGDHVFGTVIYQPNMMVPIEITIEIPKSIAFDKLGHKAACKLFDEVEAIIEAEIGVSGEQLLKERAA